MRDVEASTAVWARAVNEALEFSPRGLREVLGERVGAPGRLAADEPRLGTDCAVPDDTRDVAALPARDVEWVLLTRQRSSHCIAVRVEL